MNLLAGNAHMTSGQIILFYHHLAALCAAALFLTVGAFLGIMVFPGKGSNEDGHTTSKSV